MRNTMSQRWVDCVFRNVTADAQVVIAAFVIWKRSSLLLHLAGGLPSPADDLPDAAHCLRIRREDTEGSKIMENIFGSNSLRSDSGFSEGNVFWNRG